MQDQGASIIKTQHHEGASIIVMHCQETFDKALTQNINTLEQLNVRPVVGVLHTISTTACLHAGTLVMVHDHVSNKTVTTLQTLHTNLSGQIRKP